ncbi:2-succinyl-5-enolpyruvyl-6-hydroxy-3-cyclohexene-1-carboxylic-acid synthase [Tenacibaculum sp. IB213877]|uniref:2-succinyl-5-enolpyruvyl-6-hydroxy-3- cyclohexene-1-carboxylic-acid synthase n=1 Tax=Tenacibaculum sp. IB213877 TaxID=3097351 RepID=UPI002A5AB188|nr:2-succinyl-5-enolpyruvyl-6-hydroxy-3-cyclohexene-1-carboxylic-acid synthase [Tenacibaculum sp. IB213877]MDY0779941.1 2-succinyl-5-enolpyruvyl-6-hydroxy-3-cyclohexene-1-carboxylic-acid synthase [Tenacibaculum sp. IB213877]
MFSKKQLAQLVISACQQFKIDTAVISPGSRNAPLTVGFSNAQNIQTISVVDERCAAFFAMGIAQQTQKPVAVVCTSGSALLNYYPAIAEAFYSKIPLLIISADRPKHLIDIGDGQTIRQENVFDNHILCSANLVEGENDANAKKIAEAIQTAIIQKGPVHINVPFEEPLYETVDEIDNVIENKVKQSFNEITSFPLRLRSVSTRNDGTDYQKLSSIWNTSQQKLVLVGVNFPSEELQQTLNKLAEDDSVLVMTETTSNLNNDKFINSIDKLITKLDDEGFKKLQPDVLLTFGGMVVSKRIKQFLRKYKPKHHWHVDEHTKLDTYFCLSEFIQEKPSEFLSEFITKTEKIESGYQSYWLSEKASRAKNHQQFIKEIEYSDLKVFNEVLQSIPDNSQVQISNSSIIRYAQLFDVNPTLQVFCNRGTSGIDGSTSTAIGAAFASEKQTVFITGDISFFYDSNALWNSHISKSFRIILLNNNGGGIFKIIPGPKSTNALSYFETPHGLTAQHLAKMFGFEYQSANTIEEVKKELNSFYTESDQPKILEIFTPSTLNDVVLQQYFNSL